MPRSFRTALVAPVAGKLVCGWISRKSPLAAKVPLECRTTTLAPLYVVIRVYPFAGNGSVGVGGVPPPYRAAPLVIRTAAM